MFEYDIAHRRSVVVLCILYKIWCNPMHPLNGAIPGPYVPERLHAVPWSHIGILMRRFAAEPRSIAWLLFTSQCAFGMILLTPYSMVWDWRVSRATPMPFYRPKLLYPYYRLLLFFHFSSFCLLVGIVGLRTSEWYGVYHSLSAFACRHLLIIIIIIIKPDFKCHSYCGADGAYKYVMFSTLWTICEYIIIYFEIVLK